MILDLYSSYEMLRIDKHSGINDKWGTELLILSHDIHRKHQIDQATLF